MKRPIAETRVHVQLGEVVIDHVTEVIRHEDVAVFWVQTSTKHPMHVESGPNELHFLPYPDHGMGHSLYLDETRKGEISSVIFPDFDSDEWHMFVSGDSTTFEVTLYRFVVTPDPHDDPPVIWSAS